MSREIPISELVAAAEAARVRTGPLPARPSPPVRVQRNFELMPPDPKVSDADRAARRAALEDLELQDRIAWRIRLCGIPDDALEDLERGYNASTLPPEHAKEWRAAEASLQHFIGTQAIVALIEGFGTAKTTLAASFVRRECLADRVARYVRAYDYVEAVAAAAAGQTQDEKPKSIRDRFCMAPLLVIDECHAMPQSYGDQHVRVLRKLIDERWNLKKCTVLISNETEELFMNRIGRGLVSRMTKRGCGHRFTGEDLRGLGL